jgi:hypothetical protein
MILNRRGLPWTVPLSLGWMIVMLIVFFSTSGVLFVPLGLYLAYWVQVKGGRSVALRCYLIVIAMAILALLTPRALALYVYPVAVGGIVLMLVTPLILRTEIISLYRRSGVNLTINPILTILLSSVYLNYSIPDLPVSLDAPYPSALVQRPGSEGMNAS